MDHGYREWRYSCLIHPPFLDFEFSVVAIYNDSENRHDGEDNHIMPNNRKITKKTIKGKEGLHPGSRKGAVQGLVLKS